MYKCLIKPFFFLFDAEKAHYLALNLLQFFTRFSLFRFFILKIFKPKKSESFIYKDIYFENKIGLAAGFDKNAKYIDALSLLGFSHIEIGTVTPLPQPGNEKPRLFRLKKDNAIINRMGFNNDGVDQIVENLKRVKNNKIIIGGNIGKNKWTENEKAIDDYLICFEKLFPYVNYFTINVSSPNTPGLRALQEKEPLRQLILEIQNANQKRSEPKPIFLKIAPDLTDTQLQDIVEIVEETQLNGVIATNTTISREDLKSDKMLQQEAGGLSGVPVKDRSNEVLGYLRMNLSKEIVLIGVGGVFNKNDYLLKLEKGADLVQVYTGFIYEGPMIVKNILK